MRKFLCGCAALAAASCAFAGTTQVFTNEATFAAALSPGFYLEQFNGASFGSPFDGSQTSANFGPQNGFAWTASASLGLYSVPGALSTNNATDPLTIALTGAPATAVGGIFQSTDINGNPIPVEVVVTLSNGTTETIASGNGFRGFIAPLPIASLTIEGPDLGVNNWPAVDNFYVGVPEPTSLALLGLAGLLGLRRR